MIHPGISLPLRFLMFARTRESLSHSSLSDARFATLPAAWRRSITTAQSSRTRCTITLRSFRNSLNVPSVFKPQAVPSSEIALFGQRNVHHLEVPTICRAVCSSRSVARAGSSELPIPFQSALYAASRLEWALTSQPQRPKAASKLSHEACRSSEECVGSHESHRPNYESARFVCGLKVFVLVLP